MAKPSVLGVRETRAKFSTLLEDAQFRGQEFLIERAGKPVAVIVGADGYEEMQSELATLQEERSPEGRKRLRRTKADLEAGRVTPHDEIMHRLAAKKQ
ncbi:MAG TPA: type II toxin-antitoxin system Phd/YefM family antitoxin [Candidatus Methylomirabilis sp.]|nr:type II toxin-antitoxin system Phd/YefM family antitoxin [Candidatus Methylomirabilis sp.]